ncbi:MAG: LamG domain-containing protein [Planctomycetota bacterium]
MRHYLVVCGCIWGAFAATPGSAESKLPAVIAHWKLNGDARDSGSLGLHGDNHGVTFTPAEAGEKSSAAVFLGRKESITVPQAKTVQLGQHDFSVSLWLHTNEILDDDLGDVLSQYDPVSRKGFHLTLRNNAGITNSSPNTRQLQFGIDSGTEPTFQDLGRPGNALLGFSISVHEGELYVGTCEPGKGEAGHVYRYAGPSKWIDCGAPSAANSVSSLAVFQGRLYAGTAKYRVAGSALAESENTNLGGGIYRYDGDQKWTPCGQLPQTEAIGGMTVYKGRFYASSLYRPAGFFRYEEGEKWTPMATPNGKRTVCLGVWNGYLWATGYDEGNVYRFDGETWTDLGRVGDNTQTYSFAVHQGQLCVATWPSGKVYYLNAAGAWEDKGRLGSELEVMGMMVHNGQFYGGTLPLGQVYRFDGETRWTLLRQLDETKDVKFRRVWTAAQYAGQTFWTTLPSGKIFSMEAGKCVTHDRELPAGWRHIAAVKQAGQLRLYVDGKQVAESTEFDPTKFDLSNDQPLKIGAGTGDFFNGRLKDLRWHGVALTEPEIAKLAKE